MKFVFVGYEYSGEFSDPQAWLVRINAYTGILEALGKENEVISIEQIAHEGAVFQNDVHYHFKRFSKNALRFFPRSLHRYIQKLNPDVVFIQGFHRPLPVIQLRLLLGNSVKIIVQNHAEKPFTGIRKLLQQLADRCVNAYLFASKAMGQQWVTAGNLGSAEKIHEIMEVSSVFYPIDRFEAKAHTGVSGEQVFLWVGRLNQNKDPLTVVRAFLKYAHTAPEARLYMVYHTDELLLHLKALIDSEPNVGHQITLIGKVPHAALLYWFNSADFILSGSHYEGSGTSVCEAMSCGCIPLVTDILSFRMITNNGKCGMLYQAGNEEALVDVLMQTQHMNLATKRQSALNYFRENLSFQAIARQIQSIASSL
ncbi:glycosyltransferase family 4 protein [Runella sp.]|uniref:glycosyltransferase family 4 protein n=1 Tax=Runella sp. TaxID=1960881 RepID=UPI003D14BE15